MKYLNLLSTALLISAVACTDENVVEDLPTNSEEISRTSFEATTIDMVDAGEIGEVQTKTMVREGGEIYWVANDELGVFTNDGSLRNFITKNGGKVTRFENYDEITGEYYVFYPYNAEATIDGGTISTQLPAVQYPEPGSFYTGGNLAVAKGDKSEMITLHNACGWLKISVAIECGDTITGINIKGNNNELLAGDVEIDVDHNIAAKVIDSEKASKTIMMNTEDHIYPEKYYYFILPPITFEKGLTVTFVNKDGLTSDLRVESPVTVKPGQALSLSNKNPTNFKYGENIHTEDCSYVYNLEGLYEWADRVNKGETSLNCQLMASFDFDGREWIPVGTREHPYLGRFNGNGRELRNLKVEGEYDCAGFFGAIGPVDRNVGDKKYDVEISNIKFINPSISSSYKGDVNNPDDDGYAGVVAGMMNQELADNYSGAVIDKCDVINGAVSGCENVGGILGRSYGGTDIISRSSFKGSVTGAMFIGGIVGNVEGDVVDCHSYSAAITHSNSFRGYEARSGGIAGTNNGDILVCSANAVNVMTDGRYAGGIVGANNGVIVGCVSCGEVKADFSGGIAGESFGPIKASYSSCKAKAGVVYRIKTQHSEDFDACYTTTVEDCPPVVSPEGKYNLWYAPYIQLKKKDLNKVLNAYKCDSHGLENSFNGAHWKFEQSIDEYAGQLPVRPFKYPSESVGSN
jgi:hypothetical protein